MKGRRRKLIGYLCEPLSSSLSPENVFNVLGASETTLKIMGSDEMATMKHFYLSDIISHATIKKRVCRLWLG